MPPPAPITGGWRLVVAGTPFLEVPGRVSKNNVSTLQTLRVPVGKMGILGSRMAWVILGLLAGDRSLLCECRSPPSIKDTPEERC